jgi:Uma2 family endonuclease
VSPPPLDNEVDPNEELSHLLRGYQEQHPQGSALDVTLGEREVRTGPNRRRADRVIWAGLGRLPRRREKPTIIVEFVSEGKRNWKRDYETKRDEYMALGVKEYWVIDRFQHTMTVFSQPGGKTRKRLIRAHQIYKTDILPGFELPLARLFALADRWPAEDPST